MKNKEQLITQAEAVTKLGEKVLATETSGGHQKSYVDEQAFHDFRIAAISYLGRVFGEDSTYYQSFKSEVTLPTPSRTRRGMGMLTAARRELQGDWLETTRGVISRKTLADLLNLAKQQLDLKNYAATVVISGSVLEILLQQLCLANGIQIHNKLQNKTVTKKGIQLTGDAYKKKIYERQDNKAIISWLEIYEAATSGKSEDIPAEKVKTMYLGVQKLLVKSTY
jgi:hypothetical protein